MAREHIETELGTEVRCSKCQEFWPADPEFYFFNNGRPHSWCKACYANDPKIIAKNQRWKEKVRLSRAPRIAFHPEAALFVDGQCRHRGKPSDEQIKQISGEAL